MSFRRRRSRVGLAIRLALVLAVLGGSLGAGLVYANAFGLGDRYENLLARIDLFLNPPPDRPIPSPVRVTPPPSLDPTATPEPTDPGATPDPSASVGPTPTPVARTPVDLDILGDAGIDPASMFAHEIEPIWCAPAGVQMVLAIHGKGDTGDALQRELASRIDEWESIHDSRNGGWGPASMILALEAYGVPGYQERVYDSRPDAMRDVAKQIALTNAPAILLAWRGAHTWVMTGFTANADPTVFDNASVGSAYILDPWYPDISSIWGPSNPPGFLTSADEMAENFLEWKRPEGAYPDRDGRYVALVPTIPLEQVGG